jgi:hypothetical protein
VETAQLNSKICIEIWGKPKLQIPKIRGFQAASDCITQPLVIQRGWEITEPNAGFVPGKIIHIIYIYIYIYILGEIFHCHV